MKPTYDDIRSLVESNPGQGTFEEYAYILDAILAKGPCNLLIFGVGRDSHLWQRANEGGRTVFVEHEAEWIAETRRRLPGVEVIEVKYWTRRWQWPLLIGLDRVGLDRLLSMRDLPESVMNQRWDVIFVDSPQGGHDQRPGRMQSIYTASVLARKSAPVDFLAHDCNRKVEAMFCDRFLRHETLVHAVRTLRHYHVGERARPTAVPFAPVAIL
jgi:glucuronoxylan 4-O-methyltransferase